MSIERKESQFLAENVKRHRLKHAWTQEQLAEICSVNVRTVQRVEKQGQASLETKKALAGAFNLTVEKLTTAESFEQPKSQTTNQINEPYWKSRVRAFSKNAFYTSTRILRGIFNELYILSRKNMELSLERYMGCSHCCYRNPGLLFTLV